MSMWFAIKSITSILFLFVNAWGRLQKSKSLSSTEKQNEFSLQRMWNFDFKNGKRATRKKK